MQSVIQDWVMRLGLRHQGVLMAVIRGCDSVPKEDASKSLIRLLRGLLLNSYDPHPTSFIERIDGEEDFGYPDTRARMAAVLTNHDHYPIHYIMHLMHATEIVGYKHPDERARAVWGWFYTRLCKCFHVNPETEEQLDRRLGAGESEFAKNAKVTE